MSAQDWGPMAVAGNSPVSSCVLRLFLFSSTSRAEEEGRRRGMLVYFPNSHREPNTRSGSLLSVAGAPALG